MAVQDVMSVEFGDVFPDGAFAVGEVKEAKDWQSSAAEKPQLHVEAVDPETGEVVSLPVWLVTVNDGQTGESLVVQVVTKHRPVLPAAIPDTPYRPVELVGLAVEPFLNRDKCKAPWGGRQHRCGARLSYKFWARDLQPFARSAVAASAGNGRAKAES